MPNLTNKLVDPTGQPIIGAQIRIRLVGTWSADGAQETPPATEWVTTTDTTGTWTATLPPQSAYEGNTYYQVREVNTAWAVTIADTPATQRLRDRLTQPVPTPTATGIALDDLTDVTTLGQTPGTVLGYDGTTWKPTTSSSGAHTHPQTDVTNLVADLATKVPTARAINTGTGLTGGGDLTTDRTLSVLYGTTTGTACPGNDPRLSDSRTPTGAAGGDLTGTYPNPTIRASLNDPAAATPGLRTLGTGAQQACPGNDPRLSDSRTPTGAAGGDLAGAYPNPTVKFALPPLKTGRYYYTSNAGTSSTSAALNNGNLRLHPWWLHQTTTIDRIGAEVTAVGDAGSKIRLGIYADDGTTYPGTLLLDAGQIAGDSATVQEITITPTLTLTPGLYWVGGAIQQVTTTQPTVRTITTNWTTPAPINLGSTIPGAGANVLAYSMTGVTAALPSTYSTSATATGLVLRTFIRTA